MPANSFEDSRISQGAVHAGAGRVASKTEGSAIGRVLGVTTLTGLSVRNPAGDTLGSIDEIMMDLAGSRIAYAVLSRGGFLGIGDKLFVVPWSALSFDERAKEFILDVHLEALENAPGFDKDKWPDMSDPVYAAEIHKHYGKTPYWDSATTDFSGGDLAGQVRPVESSTHISNRVGGNHVSRVTTMEDLFIEEIRDLYDAETQLTKALPQMSEAAVSEELRDAFQEHLVQTENHVERLKRIFELVGEKPTGRKCAAMVGLIKEGDEMVSDSDETAVRDAGLIAAAQKVEHYEISGYGSARTHAQILGNNEAVRLLGETLQEEKEADEKLNQLALETINAEAAVLQ